ncbi:MAG: hypothetical protein WC540_04690 [Sulfuritalea sp.]
MSSAFFREKSKACWAGSRRTCSRPGEQTSSQCFSGPPTPRPFSSATPDTMTRATIYTRTDKGEQTAASASRELANDLRKVLDAIDGTSSIDALQSKLNFRDAAWLDRAVAALVAKDLIREAESSEGALDFTSFMPADDSQRKAEEKARHEAAEKLKHEAEAKARHEAAEKAKREAEAKAKHEAEQKARHEAEAKAKQEAEQKARHEAAEKAKREAEAKARHEAEAKAKQEAEQKARHEAAEKAKREAEAKARQEAEQKARHEAAEKAKREAEAKARQEAEAKVKQEAEQKARHEAEEKAKHEAEAKAKHEAEERARREAEEKARREAEEQKRKLAEEQELKEAAERVRRKAAEAAREEAEKQAKLAEEQELKQATERVRSKAAEHARHEAEEQAKKLAEEQARKAAEEQERRKAAEAARQEAEEQAKKLAEEQERRKAAERAREEAEQQARKLAEDLARRDAEEKARHEAEERARHEAEDRARRDAEEKVRREAEEKARREAEEKARQDAEEKARREGEEKVRREAEVKARQEAEEATRREADAQARREAEERSQREAEERSQREAEEKARQEAAERPRQEEADAQERLAAEEKAWREAEEKFRREEQEAAAKRGKRAAAKEASAGSAKPSNRAKQLAMGITALLVIGVVAIHLVSFDGQIPQFEKSLAAQFQQPVKIKAVRLSLVPQRHVRLEDVSIGSEGQIKVLQVKATGALGNLFSDKKSFSSVELDSPVVTEEGLGWLLFGKPSAGGIVFGPVSVVNATLQSKNVSLPAFDGKLQPDAEGAWQTIAIESTDKNLNLELTPKGQSVQIDFKARTFKMPFGSSLVLDELAFSATANRAELAVTEFKAFAYGGVLSGNARLKWGAQWSLAGELNAKQVDTSRLFPALVDGSRLVGKAVYAMQAAESAKLFATNRMEGDFHVERGNLLGVDLGRMVGGGAPSGTTRFSEISGIFVHDRGATQLRQVRLSEGALSAGGTAEVDADDNIRGRFAIELRMASEMRRANVVLAGTLKKIEWRR